MRVKVAVLPWLSTMMHPEVTGRIDLEHDLQGETFKDLLRELCEVDPAFETIVFDRGKGQMRYPALGVVNDRLLEFAGGLDSKLSDGDEVTLMAAYTGG
jgi:molybdopterin converting factor small subunit